MGTEADGSGSKSGDRNCKGQNSTGGFFQSFVVGSRGQLLEGRAWSQGEYFNVYGGDYDHNHLSS